MIIQYSLSEYWYILDIKNQNKRKNLFRFKSKKKI